MDLVMNPPLPGGTSYNTWNGEVTYFFFQFKNQLITA